MEGDDKGISHFFPRTVSVGGLDVLICLHHLEEYSSLLTVQEVGVLNFYVSGGITSEYCKQYSLSRERVRQIKSRALYKLAVCAIKDAIIKVPDFSFLLQETNSLSIDSDRVLIFELRFPSWITRGLVHAGILYTEQLKGKTLLDISMIPGIGIRGAEIVVNRIHGVVIDNKKSDDWTTISVLELNARTHHALIRAGIVTIEQLEKMSPGQIMEYWQIGKKWRK